MAETIEFKFDTQLLIEGCTIDEDQLNDYITEHLLMCDKEVIEV